MSNFTSLGDVAAHFAPKKGFETIVDPRTNIPMTIETEIYSQGGPSTKLNKIAHDTAIGERSVTDVGRFLEAVSLYANDELATSVFFTAAELNVAVQEIDHRSYFSNSRYITSLVLRAYSRQFNFIDLEGRAINLGLNARNVESLKDYIIKAVEDKKLAEAFPLSPTIAYVIQEQPSSGLGFNYDDTKVRVANAVQKKINSLEIIQIQLNGPDQTLFSLGNEVRNSEIYVKIDQDLPGAGKEIRLQAVGDLAIDIKIPHDKSIRKGIRGISENLVQFPEGVYDSDSPALDVLREDTSLKDKDITTYEYKFYKEQPQIGFWQNLEFWKSTPTPQELIKNTIDLKYAEFITAILLDYETDEILQRTIGGTFTRFFANDFYTAIYNGIAIDKELARRVATFNEISDAADFVDVDAGETLTEEGIDKIEKEGAEAFAKSKVDFGKQKLTDEEITDRQRFYKQCALLMNMSTLSPAFEKLLKQRQEGNNPDGPIPTQPFGGRIYRAESADKESLLTNLVSSKDASYMFEIPTHIMTQLTPKFKLFKVMNDAGGNLAETEFIFPMHTDLSRTKNFKKDQGGKPEETVPSFFDAQFDKGDGCGLKSFTVEFNGTNPAEARNDIKGNMSLYFQSFADFTRKRIDPNGNEYRFVDLIIQPKPDAEGRAQGSKIISLRQYEPTFYRIRVEMGYNIPDKLEGISHADLERLQRAVRTMNKSFFLCMIDHDFNIKNDGTVDMNFTYRAYLETALKSVKFDSLTTPELAKKRIENEVKLYEIANSQKCTKDELRELQLAIAGSEEEIIFDSLNSILRRLYRRNKVFNVTIDNEDRKTFLKRGFFTSCRFENQASTSNAQDGDLGVVLGGNFLSENPTTDFKRDASDTTIQFFYFGDLMHTILDTLHDPDTKKVAVGLENTKIILGSFDFDPYQSKENAGSYNIANIPVSVDFFSEWFRDNVLNQKSTRRTFPILNFIRSLSNHLVSNGLLESCVNRTVEQKLIFQTGQISAVNTSRLDPIGSLIDLNNPILDTDVQRNDGNLPLNGDVEGSTIQDFYHYIVLNANGSALTYSGVGKYEDDIKKGRYHVEIGSNRGIVKTVQFSKTDMQYVREARFIRQGIDGLLQLSSVYTANVEMFGNTLFYPGMELWINPYGFGGQYIGKPQDGANLSGGDRSLANILGLGGYHTITGVSTTIAPGSFKTNIASQHYYSGDGESVETSGVKTIKKQSEDKIIETGVNEDAATRNPEYCRTETLKALNYKLTQAAGDTDTTAQTDGGGSNIDTNTPPETTQASATATVASTVTTPSTGEGLLFVNGLEYFGEFFEAEGKTFFLYSDEDGVEQEVEVVDASSYNTTNDDLGVSN